MSSTRAVVAFFGVGRFLKFRHVMAAIDDGEFWILLNASKGRPIFRMIQTSDYDLAGFWRDEGYAVIETIQGDPFKTPLAVVNCVGLVKAALCIHAPFAQTPYQLFRHLEKANEFFTT